MEGFGSEQIMMDPDGPKTYGLQGLFDIICDNLKMHQKVVFALAVTDIVISNLTILDRTGNSHQSPYLKIDWYRRLIHLARQLGASVIFFSFRRDHGVDRRSTEKINGPKYYLCVLIVEVCIRDRIAPTYYFILCL
jgi:hypothetical protein